MRRFTTFRRLLAGFALLLLVALSTSTPATSAEEPPPALSLPSPASPRWVDLPSASSVAILTDGAGRVIPLTGVGIERTGDATRVHIPKLSEGTYRLSYESGSVEVIVGDGPAPQPVSAGPSSLLLTGAALGLAAVGLLAFAARRRSLPLAALAVFGVLTAGGLATLSGTSTGPGSSSDPCPVGTRAPNDCMVDHIEAVFAQQGLTAAVQRLEALASREGSLWAQGCHDSAHYLGRFAGQAPSPTLSLVSAGTLSCSFGYFHGLLEALGTYSTDEEFPTVAQEVCRELVERFSANVLRQDVIECAHGIGHAAMWRTNEDYQRARAVCQTLEESERVDECVAGAVMSWVFAKKQAAYSNQPDYMPAPLVANSLDLCTPPVGSVSPGCVDGALMDTEYTDFESALDWCRNVPSVAEVCARSLSRNIMTWEMQGLRQAADLIPGLCSSLASAAYAEDTCLADAGFQYMYFVRDYAKAKTFCASLVSEKTSACRHGIARYYAQGAVRGDQSVGEPPADIRDEVAAVEV